MEFIIQHSVVDPGFSVTFWGKERFPVDPYFPKPYEIVKRLGRGVRGTLEVHIK